MLYDNGVRVCKDVGGVKKSCNNRICQTHPNRNMDDRKSNHQPWRIGLSKRNRIPDDQKSIPEDTEERQAEECGGEPASLQVQLFARPRFDCDSFGTSRNRVAKANASMVRAIAEFVSDAENVIASDTCLLYTSDAADEEES